MPGTPFPFPHNQLFIDYNTLQWWINAQISWAEEEYDFPFTIELDAWEDGELLKQTITGLDRYSSAIKG